MLSFKEGVSVDYAESHEPIFVGGKIGQLNKQLSTKMVGSKVSKMTLFEAFVVIETELKAEKITVAVPMSNFKCVRLPKDASNS